MQTTRARYRLPFPEEIATDMLRDAYSQQVLSRNRTPDIDRDTQLNIRRAARWLTDTTSKPMLLLYGGYGNGKTTMAKAVMSMHSSILSALHERTKEVFGLEQEDKNYLYSLQSAIRQPKFCTAQQLASLASTDQQAFDRTASVGFLIIDDLGCEPYSVRNFGTEITPITDIIYRRYDGLLPTIVTTNLSKKDIRARYGDRVADRFNETFETVGYTNATYRK